MNKLEWQLEWDNETKVETFIVMETPTLGICLRTSEKWEMFSACRKFRRMRLRRARKRWCKFITPCGLCWNMHHQLALFIHWWIGQKKPVAFHSVIYSYQMYQALQFYLWTIECNLLLEWAAIQLIRQRCKEPQYFAWNIMLYELLLCYDSSSLASHIYPHITLNLRL